MLAGEMSMTKDSKTFERIVLTRIVRLNATIQGIVTGLIFGLGIFIATNWLILKGGNRVGPHLALLGQYFIGYRVTFIGSLIGLAYGFVTGFVGGYVIAWIYNWFVDLKSARRAARK